jgi:hypothetical protein
LTPQEVAQDNDHDQCVAVIQVSTPSVSMPPHTCHTVQNFHCLHPICVRHQFIP